MQKAKIKTKKSYTLQMTIRCIIFLSLLAVLAIADFFILNDQIKSQKFDAALINIAGRQRLMFERSALLARYLVNAPEPRETANIRAQLVDAIELLEDYEQMLVTANPGPETIGDVPKAVFDIYYNPPYLLHDRMKNYVTQLKVLASSRDEELTMQDSRLQTIRMVASGKMLKALDAVANEYQKQSEKKTAHTKKIQRWILEGTLAALLVLGIYLFWPMIRDVRREMDKMENMNDVLEEGIQEQRIVEDALRKTVKDLADTNRQLDEMGHELKEANIQLEKLTLLDPLTELLNRRGLQRALALEIQRITRDHSDLYAILLDLDDFKAINDTLGYAVGDIVIKEIAARLKESLRVTDHIARIGGDEFMILLPQSKKAESLRVAEKIRFAVSGNSVLLSSGNTVKVTACLGFIEVTPDISSVDELLSQINPLLHKSKRTGKNRVSHTIQSFEGENMEEFGFARQFAVSAQEHGLYALRQPIFHLSDLSPFGFEFLSRSTMEGFEMPDDFFRACLEANILTLVDHQCFKTCVEAGALLPFTMQRHLNIFPSTLINVPIPDLINLLPKHRLSESYCIEISEQQIIGNPSYLLNAVRELKNANIRIGIDDVGFGRSCLESLVLLEPHIIKIDKKCVKGIAKDESHARALKKILQVAQVLGTEIVAEGIENQEDLSMLRDLGVRYGQGFLLGKPAQCTNQLL